MRAHEGDRRERPASREGLMLKDLWLISRDDLRLDRHRSQAISQRGAAISQLAQATRVTKLRLKPPSGPSTLRADLRY
jgi:hypothetical protein